MRMAIYQIIHESIFIILLYTTLIRAKETTYYVEQFCSKFEIYKMDEGDIAYVKYSGGNLQRYYGSCSIEFYGRGDDYSDEFKICVTAETFDLTDKALRMRYAKSVTQNVKDYTKDYPPPKRFCLEVEEWFYIAFKDDETVSGFDRGKVVLKVEAIKTYDSSNVVGSIVGGVIGGIVVLSLLCGLAIYLWNRSRRGNVQGRVLTNSVAYQNQQPQQPMPGQYPTQPQQPMPGQYPTQPQQPMPGQYPTQPQQPTPTQYPVQPQQTFPGPYSPQQQYVGQGQPQPPPQYQPVVQGQQPQGTNFTQPPPTYDQLANPPEGSQAKDSNQYEQLRL